MFCFEVATVLGHGRRVSEEMGIWLCRDKHKYLDGTHFEKSHPSSKNGVSGTVFLQEAKKAN